MTAGFISITRGKLAPYADESTPDSRRFQKKWIAPAVVDVVPGLSARCGMHIKNHVKILSLAPGYNVI